MLISRLKVISERILFPIAIIILLFLSPTVLPQKSLLWILCLSPLWLASLSFGSLCLSILGFQMSADSSRMKEIEHITPIEHFLLAQIIGGGFILQLLQFINIFRWNNQDVIIILVIITLSSSKFLINSIITYINSVKQFSLSRKPIRKSRSFLITIICISIALSFIASSIQPYRVQKYLFGSLFPFFDPLSVSLNKQVYSSLYEHIQNGLSFVSMFLFVSIVAFIYSIGRRFTHPRVGFASAAIFASTPLLILQASYLADPLMDVLPEISAVTCFTVWLLALKIPDSQTVGDCSDKILKARKWLLLSFIITTFSNKALFISIIFLLISAISLQKIAKRSKSEDVGNKEDNVIAIRKLSLFMKCAFIFIFIFCIITFISIKFGINIFFSRQYLPKIPADKIIQIIKKSIEIDLLKKQCLLFIRTPFELSSGRSSILNESIGIIYLPYFLMCLIAHRKKLPVKFFTLFSILFYFEWFFFSHSWSSFISILAFLSFIVGNTVAGSQYFENRSDKRILFLQIIYKWYLFILLAYNLLYIAHILGVKLSLGD